MKQVIFFVLTASLVLPGCMGARKDIVISKETIQKISEKNFPIHKDYAVADISLYSPQVFFSGDSIGINIQYSSILLAQKIAGTVSFKCIPVYKPENTSFYMSGFELIDLTMNSHDSFTGKERLMGLISTAVNDILDDMPLCQFKANDYKQDMARMFLRGISIKGDNLVLLLSP